MNKELLSQYKNLVREFEMEDGRIKVMEKEIEEMGPDHDAAADVVNRGRKGRRSLGIQVVHGCEDYTRVNRSRAKLRERKARQELRLVNIENTIMDIEEFINSVRDSEIRILLRLYYIEGRSWREAALSMGEGYSEDACKKRVQRFFDRNP